MLSRGSVAIDLGTVNTLVWVERRSVAAAFGTRRPRLAGNAMDAAIISAAQSGLGIILGQRGARQLKTELGLTGGPNGWAEAVGLDAARRTPRIEKVPAELVAGALEPVVAAIGACVQNVLSDIPAGLAEDPLRCVVRGAAAMLSAAGAPGVPVR